ncbi:class II fructose-bisphosphate aldolase [Clostridium sp. AF19-22AC]|jgi:fructose-bisphosphate aldolase class II|uniref:Fructose-bisphosphate aldolase class II n=2 Tax=Faecalicatena orotica TaxID=1544 RepID=A0A2Y9BN00_9FIRM|nr:MULTISPECIES: class II fructose-bisphosphate aldolase [Clostridia]PWJ27773.1 fructose-bisphosphate aldolase class II [Faecalicatena orotica]RHR24213.1 class II fructose-bisphosphate aldolase [Clostridium sp. AF19-22AC]SSA57304.1 fructose-bisphosphate aldolase, class II [Faecalicatena orotica]
MLVNMSTLMADAEKNNYAVGMFTAPTMPFAEAVIEAAEEMNAPVMVGQVECWKQYGDIEIYGPIMADMARRAKVPVCLHLDHGQSIQYIMKAVRSGYTSVMADFSMLPFEENVEMVRKCVDFCHSVDISVEAMCGKMPSVYDLAEQPDLDIREYFSNPDELKEFVEATHADAMTISFGTVHNMKIMQPMLDFKLLQELKDATDCALVMHGSSGVETEQIKQSIPYGIRKINAYTKLSTSAQPALQDAMSRSEEPMFFHELLDIAKDAMKNAVKESIELFGNGYDFSSRTW